VRACAGCHTLTATDNNRKPGGDPAIPRLTVAQLATYVRVMPVHLTATQVDAVATYLYADAATEQASR
jgi:mono/diheme cytochrome c family protein